MSDGRREQLLEQYDNAALALIMDEYAQADGESLWEEYRAAGGEEAEYPNELDQVCGRTIRRYFESARRKKRLGKTARTAGIAASVVILLAGLSATLIMSVEALRVPTLNYIFEHFDSNITITVSKEATEWKKENRRIEKSVAALIPEGYELVLDGSSDVGGTGMVYRNAQHETISFDVVPMDATLSVDTEDAEIKMTYVNGIPAMYIEYTKRDGALIVWTAPEKERNYCLYASNLDSELFWEIVYAMVE